MNIDKVLLNTESNDEFIRTLMGAIVQSTKLSNDLSKGSDLQYFSLFPEISSTLNDCAEKSSNLMKRLCKFSGNGVNLPENLEEPEFYERIVDAIDDLLSVADGCLSVDCSKSLVDVLGSRMFIDKEQILLKNALDIPKPQLRFYNDIDNSRQTIFIPKLSSKPHAILALDASIYVVVNDELQASSYSHPYEKELQKFDVVAVDETLDYKRLVPTIDDADDHPLVWVDNDSIFSEMLDELSSPGLKEIAMDLEHHSIRSFQGITCLMQLSTRSKDYVIDVLAVRSRMHELLPVTANPSVTKVLHGCEHDILWLQRDFGLYVVNCFDTYFASKTLRFPSLSLAHLLKYYCGVSANKKYQLADWRQRPLPKEMMQYARDDTHYLLYIYDCLRRDLVKARGVEGIHEVLIASKKQCLGRYEKPAFDPLGYKALLAGLQSANRRRPFDPKTQALTPVQESILAALWNWRDNVARDRDESCNYIMSNSEMLRIAQLEQIPTKPQDLEKCAPLSQAVRDAITDVISVILNVVAFQPPQALAVKKKTPKSAEEIAARTSLERKSGDLTGSSVFTFTPAVISAASTATSIDASYTDVLPTLAGLGAVPASPVLEADMMFQIAGWRTPAKDLFEFQKPKVDDENRARLARTREDLRKQEMSVDADYSKRLSELVTPDADVSAMITAPTAAAGEETASIPKSYEEIYKISNVNRQKNKVKKRNRDAEDGDDGEEDLNPRVSLEDDRPVLNAASNQDDKAFDINSYFEGGASVDSGVDSTIEFAKDLGWISSEGDYTAVIDSYAKSLHSADAGKEDEDFGTDQHRPRDSLESKQKLQSRTSYQSKASPKGFDYSKIANMSSISAMGPPSGPSQQKKDKVYHQANLGNSNASKHRASPKFKTDNPFFSGRK